MAGSKSDYLENKVLDDIYGSGEPANHYVALYTVAPSDAGGGTEVSASDWTNYQRVAITNNQSNWTRTGNEVSNAVDIDYGTATIVTPVTVVAFAVHDALTGGNILHWGDLTESKQITNNDPVKFPIGGLVITED